MGFESSPISKGHITFKTHYKVVGRCSTQLCLGHHGFWSIRVNKLEDLIKESTAQGYTAPLTWFLGGKRWDTLGRQVHACVSLIPWDVLLETGNTPYNYQINDWPSSPEQA